MVIWKRAYRPFQMGGKLTRFIRTTVEDYPVVALGKGFQGIYIEGEGVFELESGGLVGDTVEMIVKDIEECDDLVLLHEQVQKAKQERETETVMVSNEEFFNVSKRGI